MPGCPRRRRRRNWTARATGWPWAASVEQTAPYALTLFLVLSLLVFPVVLVRRFWMARVYQVTGRTSALRETLAGIKCT